MPTCTDTICPTEWRPLRCRFTNLAQQLIVPPISISVELSCHAITSMDAILVPGHIQTSIKAKKEKSEGIVRISLQVL